MDNEVRTFTGKDPFWIDEKGLNVPYSRTTKLERLKERSSAKLLKDALALQTKLSEFKDRIRETCDKVYREALEEIGGEAGKGNFTWFNFDRSIKIEVNINERIDFDDVKISEAKKRLDEFLDDNLSAADAFIKNLVLDAFHTVKGKLDTKKVMSLLRYRSKIKAPKFREALDLIDASIERPSSKTYFRVWYKVDDGEYKAVDLNFASVK